VAAELSSLSMLKPCSLAAVLSLLIVISCLAGARSAARDFATAQGASDVAAPPEPLEAPEPSPLPPVATPEPLEAPPPAPPTQSSDWAASNPRPAASPGPPNVASSAPKPGPRTSEPPSGPSPRVDGTRRRMLIAAQTRIRRTLERSIADALTAGS